MPASVVKVQRDALGQLMFVGPCGCSLAVDPQAWSRVRPDPATIDAVKAVWVEMVDHILRGTPCPEGGLWSHERPECGAWSAYAPQGLCAKDVGHQGEHGPRETRGDLG
jgi:hypothetical protein